MLLQYTNGDRFALGAAPYECRPASNRDSSLRIALAVVVDTLPTYAMLDTGGVYLLCSPEVAASLSIDPADGIPASPILWRGMKINGRLQRLPVTLLASEGESLEIDATAFIPQLSPDQEEIADLPCILGLQGCLEFIRFALDPGTDTFYFGDIAG
jgi:hypothetical protein